MDPPDAHPDDGDGLHAHAAPSAADSAIACAVSASSAQILVTEALDALLAGMPELDAMAAKANRKG